MLPNKDLKPIYDKITWVWVYRDFKKGVADLSAERTMNRFGITCWPSLLLIDPVTGKIIKSGLYDVKSILTWSEKADKEIKKPDSTILSPKEKMNNAYEAVKSGEKTKAKEILKELVSQKDSGEFHLEARDLLESLQDGHKFTKEDLLDADFERRSQALDFFLEKTPETNVTNDVLPLLKDSDGDVRMKALKYISKTAPDELKKSISDFLADPLDPIKWAAIEHIKTSKSTGSCEMLCNAWKMLDENKISSFNPNVFRLNLASALAEVGDEKAVPFLESFAVKRDFRNGTTGQCVKALGKIGSRCGAKHVVPVLLKSFPPPKESDAAANRSCAYLAQRVHEALVEATGNKSLSFPKKWTEKDQKALVESWEKETANILK